MTGIIRWYAIVLNAYFPFHHKILKTTLLQGQDLIKLMISASSSMTFLNETGFFFFPPTGSWWGIQWLLLRFCAIALIHAKAAVLPSIVFAPSVQIQHSEKGRCLRIIIKISDRVPETPGKGLEVSQKSVEPAWEPFTVLYNQQSFPYLMKITATPRLHPTCGPYSN